MKVLVIKSSMLATIGGAFYPTGHSMIMFPSAEDADSVGHRLIASGVSGDEVYFIPAETLLNEIAPTARETDNPLPSAGTDAATVLAFTQLARQGHAALLVRTKDDAAAKRVMAVVRQVPYSMAQRYRTLVIEDL